MKSSCFQWLHLFILVVILACSVIPVIAQEEAPIEHDTVKARRYFERGMELKDDLRSDSAAYYFEKAGRLYEGASAWLECAKSLWSLGEYFLRKEKNNESILCLDQAIEIVQKRLPGNHHLLGNLFILRGGNLIPLGKYDSAEVSLIRGQEEIRHTGDTLQSDMANSYYRLGWLYMLKSDFTKALTHSRECLEIQKAMKLNDFLIDIHNLMGAIFFHKADYLKAKEHWEAGLAISYEDTTKGILNSNLSLLSNLGALYYEQGNYQRAYEMYTKSLEWQELMFEEPTRYDAVSFFNIAEVLEKQGQYKESEAYFKKSLEFYKQREAYEHPNIVEIYDRLGSLYLIQGKNNDALDFYRKALLINKRISHNSELSASLFQQLGRVHLANGQIDSSAFYFQQSFNLYSVIHYELHPKIADNHLQVAILRRAQSDWGLTFQACDKALYSVTHGNIDLNQLDLTDIRLTAKGIEVLSTYAKYLEEAFLDRFVTTEGLIKAMRYIDIVIELIQENRITVFDQKAQRDYSRQYLPVFQQGLNLALRLNQETDDDQYLAKAFQMMIAGKAFELNRSEQGRQEPLSYALPDSLIEYERALKVDISFYEEAILNRKGNPDGFDTTLVREYDDQLFNLKQDFEQLQHRLEQDFPKYFQLKYDGQKISLKELQGRLQEYELLIEYLWQGDLVTLVAISGNSVDFKEIVVDSLLINDLERLRLAFNEPDQAVSIKEFTTHSQHVFQTLVAPALEVAERAKKLIIIPDGPMTQMNFDLLLSKAVASDSDWKDLPYLIKDYAIATGYSASLFFDEDPDQKKSIAGMLAFSFSEENEITGDHLTMDVVRSTDLSALPGSSEEIKTIADMVDGDYFYGNSASEQTFKAVAEDYQILHLALHGSVDEENPDYSKLHFHTEDTTEDGKLHVFELYNMELNAELAVLSACNTGSGKYQTGEGIMSLGHAFSYAGVNSLLLTRWDLADEAAPEIMRVFYRELKQGKSKSEALRTAKLAYLENASMFRSNPFYWSSFFVLGDDSPVEFNTSKVKYYWMTGLMLLLSLAIFIRYRQRQIFDKQSDVSS